GTSRLLYRVFFLVSSMSFVFMARRKRRRGGSSSAHHPDRGSLPGSVRLGSLRGGARRGRSAARRSADSTFSTLRQWPDAPPDSPDRGPRLPRRDPHGCETG